MMDVINKARVFETSLDIDASPDEVWRALTEAEELMRWFPLHAEVQPGAGGSMRWSWGEGWDWQTRIEAWEPGRLLRLVQEYSPSENVEKATVAVEVTLESRDGKTHLKLVHSGFGHGDAWDCEVEGISEGWPSELRSLRLYVERHRGQDRHVGHVTKRVALPREAAWKKLTGPGGFTLTSAEPRPGNTFEIVLPSGGRITGTVEAALPCQSFTGIVHEHGDALFRMNSWSDPNGKTNVWVWLATYGDAHVADEFRQKTQRALDELFPES